MKSLYVLLSVVLLAGAALPAAAAQCSGQLTAPRLVRMGSHATPTTGNGTVRVQVQVNPNGSHVVTRIISSTNHGDDQAAREVASSSVYRAATCSGRGVAWFYDPIFHFSGSTVTSSQVLTPGVSAGSSAARIEGLIRAGQYDTAKSLAQSALAQTPSDPELLQLLGVAEYYSHDYDDAADAFSRAGTPQHAFAPVAAQAYANAAVHLSDADPQKAMEYAQRALALDHGANSRFALGAAQLGAKQYVAAIATLQAVHRVVFADPHADAQQRYGLDQRLLQAYVGAGDLAAAQPTIDEMRRMEPSNAYPLQQIGVLYINQGNAAADAKNYDQALALYDKAAALGDPKVSGVAYDRSANVLVSEPHPDVTRIKAYAEKALAIDANDPMANFFEGYVYAALYASSHNATQKSQALLYLNKADSLAKAAGIQSLAQQAERFISQLNAPAAMP